MTLDPCRGVGYEATEEVRVKERDSTPEGVAVRGLRRITAEEEKLRREKIDLLRRELAKHRQATRQIEHQLRALGDAEATRSAGWLNWSAIYDDLPARFSSREVAVIAGVRPPHVASVLHAWKSQGKVAATGKRGHYRKVLSGR
jgi:hypothetical protein